MEDKQIREKLREFISSELIHDPKIKLKDDQAIVSSGLINSFSLMEIGLFIEEEFGVFIPDADLTAVNMDTIDKITEKVQRLL